LAEGSAREVSGPDPLSSMEPLAIFSIWALGKLPFPTIRQLGRWLGYALYACARSRRRIALENLDLAYGDQLDHSEKRRIAQASFVNLVTMGLEFCWTRNNPTRQKSVSIPKFFDLPWRNRRDSSDPIWEIGRLC
jgi:lauroyl/myristoyl acyltransferase